MAKFKYTAVTAEGTTVKDVIEAPTSIGARTELLDRDLDVVKLTEKKGLLQLELTGARVPPEVLMHFSRQLAAFIRAGIPIVDAIQVISEESDNSTFRRVMAEVAEGLRSGDTFSAAVAPHTSVFPEFYVRILRSAELTGQLDTVLDQLAAYLQRDLDSKRAIRSALTYPLTILAMAAAAVVVLTTFVLPRFEKFFESLDAKLPLATRILLNSAKFVGDWWWLIIAVLLLLIFILFLGVRTQPGRAALHRTMLRLPVIGNVVRFSVIERFCRILASMIQAGVPLPEAMLVSAEGTNNVVYERALLSVREEMLRGEGFARPLSGTQLFPPTVIQMVRVGEDTGTLDQQLTAAASYYEQELAYKIKRLTTLFEPAVIIFVGLVVGFVAVALVSAMYGIFRQVGTL